MMRPAHQPRAALGASADAQSNAQPPPRHSRSKTPPVRRATTPVSRQLHSSHQQLQQAIGGRTTPIRGGRFATPPLASSSSTSLLASMLPTNGLHHPHHHHHNTHLVTPGSARSKASSSGGSIADLEDTIVEVLGVRMQSLVDLRQRVDQLGDLYRREEETFRHQMRQVLERSEEVRVTNESREVELERALAKERADRTKVLELMSQFKKEGAAVIQVMKESLQEATTKWKAELEKNAKLTAQLRRHGGMDTTARSVSGNPTDGAAMNVNGNNSNAAASAVSSAALQTRIDALTQLVQEEDSIIVALRSRNRALEQRVAVLTQQRDKLLEVDADQCVVTGSLQGELYDIQQAVRRCDAALIKETGASSSSPLTSPSVVPTPKGFRLLAEKCEALDRYSKLLLQRLSIEQRQRLRVEEQSARIASAQDQLVQSLESRIKDLGGGGGIAVGGASGGGAATPKHTAAAAGHQDGLPRFRPRGGSSSPLSSGVGGGNASTSTRNATMNRPASGSSIHQGGEECSEDDDDGVVEEVREVLDEVSNTRVVLPLVSSTSRSSSTRAAASAATVVTVAERSASASSQVGQRNPPLTTSAPIVPLSSLEAQLALVTREFHDSVDEWSREQQQQQLRSSNAADDYRRHVAGSSRQGSAESGGVNGDDL